MDTIALKHILKILIGIVLIPVYIIIRIIPRNKKLWVFGSWDGKRIADNTLHAYNYIKQNHKDIKCIWFTKSKKLVNDCKQNNIPCLYSYSLKGIWTSFRAGVWIYTHSAEGDIMFLTWPGAVRVFLGHTIPVKKLYFNEPQYTNLDRKLYRIGRVIAPILFSIGSEQICPVNSQLEKEIYQQALLAKDNLKIIGHPRNDVLIGVPKKTSTPKRIMYAPTHRVNSVWKSLVNSPEFWKKLDAAAEKNNLQFDVKLHDSDSNTLSTLDIPLKNIKLIKKTDFEYDFYDLNMEMHNYDAIISDYSGVIFDYMLLRRPILLFIPDLEEYQKERGIYKPSMRLYDFVNNAKTVEELCSLIETLVKNPESLRKLAEKMVDEHHHFQDGNNSKRLVEEIQKLI